jgi:chemotaxis receptor (MCP) glutamine deamidase CheD
MCNVPLETATHILEKTDFCQKMSGMKTIDTMPRLQVASGSYVVMEKTPQILEAHLGTCVGVTLCDRNANVGGLIHLLLPEPTGMQKDWQPALYATTGLPLFLQALSDAGASKDNLKAFVAGGALIGPLSEEDLDLNIGGRTTEIVEETLHREGIPVYKSETGGYFGCF